MTPLVFPAIFKKKSEHVKGKNQIKLSNVCTPKWCVWIAKLTSCSLFQGLTVYIVTYVQCLCA